MSLLGFIGNILPCKFQLHFLKFKYFLTVTCDYFKILIVEVFMRQFELIFQKLPKNRILKLNVIEIWKNYVI